METIRGQLEFDFFTKSKAIQKIENEIEKKAWRNFCYHNYTENCVERHQEQREIYKNKFRYIKRNYLYLKREFEKQKSLWVAYDTKN
jgi:hypothetical protein